MERFNRLAHSVRDCKYHIVWIPKYRHKELYGTKRRMVVDPIKQWARIKGLEITESCDAGYPSLRLDTARVFYGSHHWAF